MLRAEFKTLMHNTAQLAHCQAQGKVGSGFDVSSAFFGSQLYARFDPASLQAIMKDVSDGTITTADGLAGSKD
jgi:phosphomevalonate kinase